MPSIKHRRRAKRRAEKLVEESLDALASGHDALADKLIQRALSAGPANARFWLEYARISRQRGLTRRTERAVRRALELSPDFAEARELLDELVAPPAPAAASEPIIVEEEVPVLTARTERFDWSAHEDELVSRGVTHLPALVCVDECVALRELFAHDAHFEHDVQLDDERGRVRYRFFRRPLPALVTELRTEVYARLAPIANRFNELVGDEHRWPLTHAAFARSCAAHGHARTSPILLRYEAGGFNGFHRDVYGSIYFPLQMAVSLGPARVADGGELALVDDRPGKRKRVRVMPTDIGDAIVFCTRDRLTPIAGLYGRQPVMHGVQEVRAERFAVGIPFHDYAGT
ncbi:MAG: 2OG-Fe(II) oxygenase family protein [Kofleriaceae bacterium]